MLGCAPGAHSPHLSLGLRWTGPRTCIHWSSKFSSSGHTVSLHLAFLVRAVNEFRKSSFSEILQTLAPMSTEQRL